MNQRQKRIERNTIISVVVMIAILVVGSIALKSLLAPKDNTNNNPTTNDSNNASGNLKDGTYTAESAEPSNGYTGLVTMEVAGGKITSLVYDSLNEQGESKRYLSSVGEYVMVEGNPTWEEQADLLAKHVIENQSVDKLVMDDNGKTDAVSGVSINISEFVALTKDVLQQAAGESTTTSSLNDGTYTAESAEPSNGYTGLVTMEVAGGNITSLVYDSLNEQGESKRYLSSVGEYVMVEGNPTWEEQADLLAKHVIENQSVDKLVMDDSGKTDAVSGVSINITEFVNLTKDVLKQAAGETAATSDLQDGSYSTESEEASNGYTGLVTIEVTDGKITSLVYDSLNEQGESKRYLSSVGEYVMVEGNPTWEEQADLLAKHVIENQSLDKLVMDDSGKTDAVSGVSINITEFVNLTKSTLEKAAKGITN